MTDLKPCPHCGRPPHVYHGVHGGEYGDSVECGGSDCPDEDWSVWNYTSWNEAVRRWNEYADRKPPPEPTP